MGKERRGRREEEEEGGEKAGLPPLEWRSGYAPGITQPLFEVSSPNSACRKKFVKQKFYVQAAILKTRICIISPTTEPHFAQLEISIPSSL